MTVEAWAGILNNSFASSIDMSARRLRIASLRKLVAAIACTAVIALPAGRVMNSRRFR